MRAPLDRVDRALLKLLQADGRMSVAELAREVHLSSTPCADRLRRLENLGYIKGYFANLDPARLGQAVLAYVQVRLDRSAGEACDRFKNAMLCSDLVQECQMIAGSFDYLLKVRVGDLQSYQRFLKKELASLSGVIKTRTHFVIEEVKATHAIRIEASP